MLEEVQGERPRPIEQQKITFLQIQEIARRDLRNEIVHGFVVRPRQQSLARQRSVELARRVHHFFGGIGQQSRENLKRLHQ